jgi:hypothetical protein
LLLPEKSTIDENKAQYTPEKQDREEVRQQFVTNRSATYERGKSNKNEDMLHRFTASLLCEAQDRYHDKRRRDYPKEEKRHVRTYGPAALGKRKAQSENYDPPEQQIGRWLQLQSSHE